MSNVGKVSRKAIYLNGTCIGINIDTKYQFKIPYTIIGIYKVRRNKINNLWTRKLTGQVYKYQMYSYWAHYGLEYAGDSDDYSLVYNFSADYLPKVNSVFFSGLSVNNDIAKSYVNGVLSSTISVSGQVGETSLPLQIGYHGCDGWTLDGNIYLFAVFNEAKDSNWIQSLYNDWRNGNDLNKYIDESCMVWLDGDSINEVNQVWRDKSGNGNNGQFEGNVQVVKDISITSRSGLVFNGINDYVKGLNVRNLQFTNNKTIVLFGNMLKKVKNYKSLYMYSYPTPYHIYSFDGELYFRIVTDSSKIDFSEYRINMLHRDTFGAFILSGDGTNFSCKTYEDGILLGEKSNTISGNFVSGDNYYQINDIHYNIKLSLFAVFNEAKPDDWIKQFYEDWENKADMSKYWQDESCVLWLDGDSIGKDGIWYDKSKYKNDGTIYGARKVSNVL